MKRLALTVVPAGVLSVLVLVFALGGSPEAARTIEVAYEPEQPIAFSHRIHAGENQIPCQVCHAYAERSPHAGLPPVMTCMNCHKVIDGPNMPEEVQKIREAWETKEPIEWVKVFDNPDFVYFSHRVHVQIGEELGKVGDQGFNCQTCHGPVEEMTVAALPKWDDALDEEPLSMGWCLTCHKNKKEDVALVMKLKQEAHASNVHWESLIGSVEVTDEDVRLTDLRLRDCWACHK